ncbi:flagellar biosynthesis protein FlhA [Maricaulis sp. D1M11]|uniref:flagellar biosynthesis protein FlhA n=1 Tax=Maricaulis sp. D1M11 TaxID=3076117 RepID=UPI0039B5BC80
MFKLLRKNKDLALVLGVVLILVILFSPIPAVMLDLAILINFGFGLTILLLTLYVKKPVEFSTFPSLLLIATLYRLALNIAATRLILTGGDAGDVINSIGEFAVQGQFVVGLVVFFILVVVQYVVVTSGAQRVSEVAARFTLDSMPGQQMSIDADLNMGLIDQDEARARREALEKEAAFYGSMDGASKFVKGDSIAGVIIVLIDIIAGLIIGVVQMGMSWPEALETFTLLTIGDGIATQLPALIISIATGIIVTRSSADRELSAEVFKQLTSITRIPLIVAGILLAMTLLPGMPRIPIGIVVVALLLTWFLLRRQTQADGDEDDGGAETQAADDTPFPALSIALGARLSEAWAGERDAMLERISSLREQHEKQFGLAFPAVTFMDGPELGGFDYDIRIFGTPYARGELEPDQILAVKTEQSTGLLSGRPTRDPSFGLDALWIDADQQETAAQQGYTCVDPVTVLMTHLGELMRIEAPTLLTRATVTGLLDGTRRRQPGLVEELVPTLLSMSDIQQILQNLVMERVSIANVDLILEHLCDCGRQEKDPTVLTERVREKLSYVICNQLRDRHRELNVLSLDPRIENQLVAAVGRSQRADSLPIEPRLAETVLRGLDEQANAMQAVGFHPVLLCSAEIRRAMKKLTSRSQPRLAVISVNEIPKTIELKSFGVVQAPATESQPALATSLRPDTSGASPVST